MVNSRQKMTRDAVPDVPDKRRSYEDMSQVLTEQITESHGPITVEEIKDAGGLELLRETWNELLSESAANNLFLTWEWIYTWWKHLGAPRKLHVLVVRRMSRLIAIAPLAVRPPQPRRLSPFLNVEFLGMGSVGSDYLNLIIRPGEEDAALDALSDHLCRQGSVLELKRVRSGSTATSWLATRLEQKGWRIDTFITEVCPYIWLKSHNWESYLASLGSSHRQNLRRRLRRVEKAFTTTFTEVKTEEERHECLKLFELLHHKRWNLRHGSDAINSDAVMRFHEEFSHLALQRGWLRLFLLRLNGRPAASIYGFTYGDVFYYYQAGFDPEFGKYSVGLVAMGLSIQNAINQGVREYDMLHGGESYKFLWARSGRRLNMLRCYPPGVYGLLALRTEQARDGIKQMLRYPLRYRKPQGPRP